MNRRSRQRGATLVESAVVSFPFFTLVLGMLSLAYLVFTWNTLAFMASQGARWASVRGNTSASPATSTTVSNYVATQQVGLTTSALSVTTTWSPNSSPGSTVTVKVSYSATPLAPGFLARTLTLQRSASAMIVR